MRGTAGFSLLSSTALAHYFAEKTINNETIIDGLSFPPRHFRFRMMGVRFNPPVVLHPHCLEYPSFTVSSAVIPRRIITMLSQSSISTWPAPVALSVIFTPVRWLGMLFKENVRIQFPLETDARKRKSFIIISRYSQEHCNGLPTNYFFRFCTKPGFVESTFLELSKSRREFILLQRIIRTCIKNKFNVIKI